MKLLVTARDAGAAFNIIEIVKQASLDKEIELYVYAQKPAFNYFNAAGIEVHFVNIPLMKTLKSEEADNLIHFSKKIINDIQPDAILAGLSTPIDGGLDEAAIFVAKGKIPTFVMQDFWGEANHCFGVIADYYLALDDDAVRITEKLHQAKAVAIGSPKHSVYQQINIGQKKEELRKKLNISDETQTIGFFGQALHHIPGYHLTIKHWAAAINKLDEKYCILYRKHPREDEKQAQQTKELLTSLNLTFKVIDHANVIESLLSCDVVCSLFSNCSYDASYLNYFSSEPCVVPMVLFFEPSIVQYFVNTIETSELPYLEKGMAIGVENVDSLQSKLKYALSKQAKMDVWQACKNLKNPSLAAQDAINTIKSYTSRYEKQ